MESKIAPSIMCASIFMMDDCIAQCEQGQVELLHVDVMDGIFVPNLALGTDMIRQLKQRTSLALDIHLMITQPEAKLDWFAFGAGDSVSVHCESTPHLQKAIGAIKDRGAKASVALNPATPICVLEPILEQLDSVLVMTVNPGFAGQKLVASTLRKISTLREYLDHAGFPQVEVEVDGNVSFENAVKMRDAGANIFVAGTSSVFSGGALIPENLERLRQCVK